MHGKNLKRQAPPTNKPLRPARSMEQTTTFEENSGKLSPEWVNSDLTVSFLNMAQTVDR